MKEITVIGGGLAGCEAAWQLLKRGHKVILYEMKPHNFSPAHKSPHLAELVCSNSLRANSIENAVGLLKEEMRRLGSLIMEAADKTAVPAGKALAVDREKFSRYVEEKLQQERGFTLVREEIRELPYKGLVIVATGPLTSPALAEAISRLTDREYLYFYDAISPIIAGDSINYAKVFRASRYEESPGDYLNCPMDKEKYEEFWSLLVKGECVPLRAFEEFRFFEGCLPIEVLAQRGKETLLFGPMKPVGLIDPRTGRQPYAVVQLRQENLSATLFNMVGFQTKLTIQAQKAIFRTIPGLEEAQFVRFGSVHRNTFLNAPTLLNETLALRKHGDILFAGQITGVEGYVESAAIGLMAGLSVHCKAAGRLFIPPPATTAHGALINYLVSADPVHFQPMNVNFGLFTPLSARVPKKLRGLSYAKRALHDLKEWYDRYTSALA